jgi:signal transduction histidine kinase
MDIVTDKTKLSQIMLNLIRNAIKFTDEGTISYGVKLFDDNAPYFFVEDTGTGISEEALGFIFQAFRQVEETISRSHGGLGLGLTISKELVSLLGGELKVKSEINKGSIFYFQIPGVVIS